MKRYVFRPARRLAQMGHGPKRNLTAKYGEIVEVDEVYAAHINAVYAGVDGADCLVPIGEPIVIEVIAPEPEHVPDVPVVVDVLPPAVVLDMVRMDLPEAATSINVVAGIHRDVSPEEPVADNPAIVPGPDEVPAVGNSALDIPEPEAPAFAPPLVESDASVAPALPAEAPPESPVRRGPGRPSRGSRP